MYLDRCCITDILDKPGLVQITGFCPDCGEPWFLVALKENVEKLAAGEEIQKVFPNMTFNCMILLLEGLCNVCWEKASEKVANKILESNEASNTVRGSVPDNKGSQS
jgi:predicted amidophosphoribosyltransferase